MMKTKERNGWYSRTLKNRVEILLRVPQPPALSSPASPILTYIHISQDLRPFSNNLKSNFPVIYLIYLIYLSYFLFIRGKN